MSHKVLTNSYMKNIHTPDLLLDKKTKIKLNKLTSNIEKKFSMDKN